MIFRFTLTDPVGGTKVISEPSGWKNATIGFERHPDFHSLVEFYKSSFQTYGSNLVQDGGRDWLLAVENTYGADAEVQFLAEVDYNEDGTYTTVYQGVILVDLFVESLDNDHFLEIIPGQKNFWQQFISRFDHQVDIQANQNVTEAAQGLAGTIAPTPSVNLPLPPQIIDKRYEAFQKFNKVLNFSPPGVTNGSIWFEDAILDFDTTLLEEVDKTEQYGNQVLNASNVTTPVIPFAKFICNEEGDMDIDFAVTLSMPQNDTPDHINGNENRTYSTVGIFQVIIEVNAPSTDHYPVWNSGTTYAIGAIVKMECASFNGDPSVYISITNGNTNNNPISTVGFYWVTYNERNRTILYGSPRNITSAYKRNDGRALSLYSSQVTDYVWSGTLKGLKRNDQIRIYAKFVGSTANFVFWDSTGTNIYTRALYIWGSQGWDKNDFSCFLLGGESFIPYGFTDSYVEQRFSTLISDTYDPTSDVRRNLITNLPVFEDGAYLLTTILNDTFIVGVPGTVGSGVFTQNVDVGDYIQMSLQTDAAGTITCNIGSPNVVGVGTNFTVLQPGDLIYLPIVAGITRDPTYYIGQVLSVTNATNLVLAANATVNYAGKAWGHSRFWVSKVSLYQGLEQYGNTHLNVTFHSEPGDVGSVLNQAITSITNNYALTNNSISAVTKGLSIIAQFDQNNTGAATLNVNGTGAVPITKLGGVALVANDITSQFTTTGTNAYSLSAYSALIQLLEGLQLVIKFVNANTGACTLNVNGLGAIPILNKLGGALATGDIGANTVHALVYDGTNFNIVDTDQSITGQIYVLDFDGTNFTLTIIASTTNISPLAAKTCQAFLAHDAMAGVLDRITDYTNLFYSLYLGNQFTERVYGALGLGSLLAIAKGLHIRGYRLNEKQFFTSASDWWDGINPILNLGLGYDTIAGNDVIRVEQKSFYYPTTAPVVNLSNVRRIRRIYDNDLQFNEVKFGYSKWQAKATTGITTTSGIDDPQSQKTSNTVFRNIGKSFSILSGWIAAGLAIETTRRVGKNLSSSYEYDDDTMVISVRSNGDGTFQPELAENISAVSGINNPTSRYNLWLSSMRNFLRWLPYLSAAMQKYLATTFKFASGTGNYNMSTTFTDGRDGSLAGTPVVEDQNTAPTNTPYHVDELFEINHSMDWLDYQTLRTNRHIPIGISQTAAGWVPFHIKELEFNIVDGTVRIQAWPQTPFTITVPDTDSDADGVPVGRYFEEEFEGAFE